MSEKTCSRCQQIKDFSQFSPDKRAKDGLQSACRECDRIAQKLARDKNLEAARKREAEYRAQNKERINENIRRSKEKHRDKVLAAKREYYQRVKDTPEFQERSRKYRERTKAAKKKYDQQYNRKHSRKKVEAATRWIQSNPDRRRAIVFAYDAKRRSATQEGASGMDIKKWADNQTKVCYWCDVLCPDHFHIDHYVPLSKGGSHELDNLVISCPECNLRKNATDPYEFAAMCGRLF